jgi:geranylgeranyl pyrophosphate synthase
LAAPFAAAPGATGTRRAAQAGLAPTAVWDLPQRLGLADDVTRVAEVLDAWLGSTDPEVRPMIQRQLAGRAKRYRPATVFGCYRAVASGSPPDEIVRSAAAVELIHNVSLIVDDILDRSRYRRGAISLHCRFGFLPALMTSGYVGFAATTLVADDAYAVRAIAELMQRLGSAECRQWRLRRRPLGLEDWRAIAGEDTGSMFEICARLGTRDDRLRRFGRLLGLLYHGCDDVADVRGTAALGGGSEKDIADGILTLPAAVAIRDAETAVLFGSGDDLDAMTERLVAALPEAERQLDGIAAEAIAEAKAHARAPRRLLELVAYTRELSGSE